MEIGSARESEVAALIPLIRGYCEFYGASPADDGLEEMARALIAAPDEDGMLLAARGDDGQPVGFAACGWKWSSLRGARIVVLEDLFVAPEFRGRGAASALIAGCARRARELGAPVITWLTAPDNHRARAVYDRAGATADSFLEYELELG